MQEHNEHQPEAGLHCRQTRHPCGTPSDTEVLLSRSVPLPAIPGRKPTAECLLGISCGWKACSMSIPARMPTTRSGFTSVSSIRPSMMIICFIISRSSLTPLRYVPTGRWSIFMWMRARRHPTWRMPKRGPGFCRTVLTGKIDLIITQKVSNVTRNPAEITLGRASPCHTEKAYRHVLRQ